MSVMEGHLDPAMAAFGPVWDAAGARGFDGSGWGHHWLLRLLGLRCRGSTFVAKTITAEPRLGNTPFEATPPYRPLRTFPDSVVFWPRKRTTLNAWGLSGPGVEALAEMFLDFHPTENFQVSFMPVGADRASRLEETQKFARVLGAVLKYLGVVVGVQLNASCPNTDHNLDEFVNELKEHLDILAELGIMVFVKESVDTPFTQMLEVVGHAACTGLVTTNCVAWRNLPDWKKVSLTGGLESPLAKYGGGGISGPYLLPFVVNRIRRYRQAGFAKHINGGGGVSCVADAKWLFEAGADSIFWGTVANYAPWQVPRIIRYAQRHALASF